MHRTAPCEQQDDTNQDEREAEPGRNPKGDPVSTEAEPGAQRQANDPVSSEVAYHRRTRVTGTAQGSRGHSLNTIKQLKGCTRDQEQGSAANDRFVRGIHPRDPARKNQEADGGKGHECCAEKKGGAADTPDRWRLSARPGGAHPTRCGRGWYQYDHVTGSD